MQETAKRIWRFLSKPRGPFRRSEASREERRLLGELTAARCHERILEAAATRGEHVGDKLANVKAEIADLAARLPRGHTVGFCAFVVIYISSLAILWSLYGEFGTAVCERWGTLDNAYLLRYRYLSSRLAKAGFLLVSSVWTGLALLTVPAIVWFVQRKLERRYARALAAVAGGLVLAMAFVFFVALIFMLFRPLLPL